MSEQANVKHEAVRNDHPQLVPLADRLYGFFSRLIEPDSPDEAGESDIREWLNLRRETTYIEARRIVICRILAETFPPPSPDPAAVALVRQGVEAAEDGLVNLSDFMGTSTHRLLSDFITAAEAWLAGKEGKP